MSRNDLRNAQQAKQDEFYTQLVDIEKEMRHYRSAFEDKTVFCNCDDPFESNFFKYFAMNFNFLKLKKLICTCYAGSPISHTELGDLPLFNQNNEPKKIPYMIQINEVTDQNGDGAVDMSDIETLLRNDNNLLTILDGDGDFRSEESIGWLRESDIVVTNPPFSLFREYVDQLITNKKQFIIIGNQNAITYKEIFKLLMEDKMWLGYGFGDMSFRVPDYYEARETRFWVDDKGKKWRSLGNICWFTNLDTSKRHEEIILYKKYSPQEYPTFDNYQAINVNRVADIPCDYDGLMAVPITFMDKYNPEQFEIVDALNRYALFDKQNTNSDVQSRHSHTCNINGKSTYFRIVIKRR